MSLTDTVEDIVEVRPSHLHGRPLFDFEKPFAPIIEHQHPSPPMAVQSKSVLSAPDRVLFRLNRLFKPTKDIGSVLTTFNYSLYVLAYLDAKAHKLKSKAYSLINSKDTATTTITTAVTAPEHSSFAKFGSIVYDARSTLRLFGLLPLYVRARRLITDSKNMDQVLHLIALVQVSFFATYQLLENVAFLKDNKVLSSRGFGKWTGRTAALYKIAHRAWFLGILCEFARLMREAQLFFRKSHIDKVELTEEEAERASQWYTDWIQPLAWLPISWKLSAWKNDDAPGFNLGVTGIAGVLADLRRTVTLWHATKEA